MFFHSLIQQALIREVINFWAKYETEIHRATGLILNKGWESDPLSCIGKLLKKVGYKFEMCYKNDDERRYRVVRSFTKPLSIDQLDNPIWKNSGRITQDNYLKLNYLEYLKQDEIDLILANIAQKTEEYIKANETLFLGEVLIA